VPVIDVDGLLIDLEGTVVVSGGEIPGAADALRALRDRGVPFRFATNSTGATRADLAGWLGTVGLEVRPEEIVTAPVATAAYLRTNHPDARCLLVGERGAAADLEGIELVDPDADQADVVVLAGAGPAYTWEAMNRAYRLVLEGAPLVAMHRNLAWRTAEGMTLDSGMYVIGLERAAGVEATVVGKPSPSFFRQAVEALGTGPQRTAMVGDDLDADVLAAQAAGLTGVLVRTGKFDTAKLERSDSQPDLVIDSVAELPSHI
jgi:HAD superfamily hydrolase (TIGR01458 family)